MTDREQGEYQALRATIATRGTARVVVFASGLSVWAALSLTILWLSPVPLATLFPLLALAGVFEAVFALHVGVERIGRYLQVFHEDTWESTAMTFGAPLAGTGSDPLFSLFFALATLCNFVPVAVAGPVPSELGVLGFFHVALLVRIAMARRAASRQRAADLARFQQLKPTRRP
jgi:hypothetical protein